MRNPFKEIIYRGDGKEYLIRYTLFWSPWFKIRIHHIKADDDDCLHDHPWDFVSFILKGGYWEHYDPIMLAHPPGLAVARKSKWFGPGKILYRPACWRHKLKLPYKKTCWTLVFMFRVKRLWGFWTRNGFIPHYDYDSKKC